MKMTSFCRLIVCLFLFSLVSQSCFAQNISIHEMCELPNSCKESSGIYIQSRDSVWSQNDNGNSAVITLVDTSGNKIRKLDIVGANNIDWEELAKDAAGNLYIGDFGNNGNDRDDLRVLRIENPATTQGNEVSVSIIHFSFADQTAFPPPPSQQYYNCEAMLLFGDSIFVFTKDNSTPFIGSTRIYWFPNTPGNHTAQYIGQFFTDNSSTDNGSVTGATLSPDQSKVIIMSNSKLWLFRNFENHDFQYGEVHELNFPENSQKEAVAFSDECHVYFSDEKTSNSTGGRLYEWNICSWFVTDVENTPAESTSLVTVFPQPASANQTLRYQLPTGYNTALLTVFDPIGRTVTTQKFPNSTGELRLILPMPGIYYYRITDVTGRKITSGTLLK